MENFTEGSKSLRIIVRNGEPIRLHRVKQGDIIEVYEDDNLENKVGGSWVVTGDPTISYPDGVWGVEVRPYENRGFDV